MSKGQKNTKLILAPPSPHSPHWHQKKHPPPCWIFSSSLQWASQHVGHLRGKQRTGYCWNDIPIFNRKYIGSIYGSSHSSQLYQKVILLIVQKSGKFTSWCWYSWNPIILQSLNHYFVAGPPATWVSTLKAWHGMTREAKLEESSESLKPVKSPENPQKNWTKKPRTSWWSSWWFQPIHLKKYESKLDPFLK